MTRRRVALLQTALSVVSLGAVVWWASRQEAPELPRTADALATVGLALLLYAAATVARAERWHRILERNGVAAGRGETYRLTTVGYMGNNVLPARGGDLLRVFLLAPRVRAGRRQVLGTVVAERLLDALALGLVFLVLAYGLVRDADAPGGTVLALVLGGGALVAAAALVAVRVVRRRGLGLRAREFLRPLAAASRDLPSPHGLGLLALSLGIWTLEGAVYSAVAHAVELELGLVSALYVVALTNLFALVPAAPGYIGTFDAAVVFAVKALGHAGSLAVSYLLLLRFVLFVPITLVGFAFLVARYGGWAGYRESVAARRATPLP